MLLNWQAPDFPSRFKPLQCPGKELLCPNRSQSRQVKVSSLYGEKRPVALRPRDLAADGPWEVCRQPHPVFAPLLQAVQVSFQTFFPQFALYSLSSGLASWKCPYRGLEKFRVNRDGVVWRSLSWRDKKKKNHKLTRKMCSTAAKEDAFNFQWGGSIKVTGGPEAFRDQAGEEGQTLGKTLQGWVWTSKL